VARSLSAAAASFMKVCNRSSDRGALLAVWLTAELPCPS
jgi:hypothetical protein